jgi:hypothetical protein
MVLVGAGDDAAARVGQHQVEIDRIEAVDGGQPLAGLAQGIFIAGAERRPERGIGRPPAHVGGALVEVANDELDQGLREVGKPRPLHDPLQLLRHRAAQRNAAQHRAAEAVGDLVGLVGQELHFLGDDRKALARLTGARCLDDGVEREQPGLHDDRLVGGRVGLQVAADAIHHQPHGPRRRMHQLCSVRHSLPPNAPLDDSGKICLVFLLVEIACLKSIR